MRDYDYKAAYHGKMAKSALFHAAKDANALRSALGDQDTMPQWVHYKIATAAHDLRKVNRYMQYQMMRHPQGTARMNPATDSAHLGRAIKRITRKLKKEVRSNNPLKRKAAILLSNTLQLNPKNTEDLLGASLKTLQSGDTGTASDRKVGMLIRVTARALVMWQKALTQTE